MVLLGVNIDHIATLRQARRECEPDPIQAAVLSELAGADGITVHLREDRRHIQDRDVKLLRQTIKTRLNLEMAATDEMVRIARTICPDSVCLVPEKRQELTTEGGLDAVSHRHRLRKVIRALQKKKVIVSLFIDPNSEQVKMAKSLGADAVELHTGGYASKAKLGRPEKALEQIYSAGALAVHLGLILNAGHGLDYRNVVPISRVPGMHELNIGFSIIGRAVLVGLERAVKEMKELINYE